jgi:hypothetical protein
MTIGLIDPALLLERDHQLLRQEIDLILSACRDFNIRVLPFPEYWPDLWRHLGRALEETLPPQAQKARQALQQLRVVGQKNASSIVLAGEESIGAVWKNGFEQLFGNIGGTSWTEKMAAATLRAVGTGDDVVLFTRILENRNVTQHRTGETTLLEITRWVLHVQSKAFGRRQVLCVHHPRNISERWTARFDWRLPSPNDGAGYPFCVPGKWWQQATPSFKTIRSKPCWIDRKQNGWARPNINEGSGYHWDVFIENRSLAEAVGLDQINVVEFGAPQEEGKAGSIHHVPNKKAGKIDLKKRGWTCD